MIMARTRKSRSRKRPAKPQLPDLGGDHGPNTPAATAGTYVEPLTDAEGRNPNNLGRRRRKNALSGLGLSMRQAQAGEAIRDAYARVESLSSGGPLKAKVDASPKPDEVVTAQVEAQSHLAFVMAAVPSGDMRRVVEHVCWNNQPVFTCKGSETMNRACLKVALYLVANKLRY